MPKFVHRAKTLPAFPQDYYERWDATTSAGITFGTGSDIGTWVGQCGNYTLSNYTAGTAATWAPGAVTFAGSGGVGLRTELTASVFDANPRAVFVSCIVGVASPNNGSAFAGPEAFIRLEDFSDDVQFAYNDGASNTASPTNEMNDRRLAFGYSTDLTDINWWWGANSKGTDTVTGGTFNEGLDYLYIGAANTSTATTLSGEVNEVILYDRHLTDAEAEQVLNYLSNKWSAQNEDSASTVIATASTAATWQNNNIDKAGEGTLNPPGSQPGEYSVVELGDRDAPADTYIQDTFGANIKYWFDAADTGHMTFATGDARSGGTVSAWTDRTGTFTADTATSGDSAVDFFPSYRGRPCIKGGTSGTPKSLEESITGFSTTATHERLFWFVVDFGQDAVTETPAFLHSGITSALGPQVLTAFNGDLPTNPVCAFVDSTASLESIPVSLQSPTEKNHVFVFRTTSNGASTECEGWYGGMKFCHYTDAAALDDASYNLGIGATATSSFDSQGAVFELGAVDSGATAITDTQVHNVIRLLCDKYDVDYMSDTTPMDIGLQARSTSTVAQTDCCIWYRSDKNMSETSWALHPACGALHTSPEDFTMRNTSSTLAVEAGRRHTLTDEVTYWVSDNGYLTTETTDFPAELGCSGVTISYHDSATVTSSGSTIGSGVSFSRFSGVSDTIIQHLASNSSSNWADAADQWNMIGSSYLYDDDASGAIGEAGTPDGTPGHWKFLNDRTDFAVNAGAAGTFNLLCYVGASSTGLQLGIARCREMVYFKHAINGREKSNLKRYFNWRYRDLGLTP